MALLLIVFLQRQESNLFLKVDRHVQDNADTMAQKGKKLMLLAMYSCRFEIINIINK